MERIFEVFFSYGQFAVQDTASNDYPEWTPTHSNQGFASLPACVAFGTFEGFGVAKVRLIVGAVQKLPLGDRVISVPFRAESGSILIFAPDEYPEGFRVDVDPGEYRLTCAQSYAGRDEDDVIIEEVVLLMERLGERIRRSEIVVCDAQLQPTFPLLESEDTQVVEV